MSEGTGIDTRGIPSRVCLTCGGEVFKVLVQFDDDGVVAWHTTNGYCAECRSPVTVPTPLDTVQQLVMEFPDEY